MYSYKINNQPVTRQQAVEHLKSQHPDATRMQCRARVASAESQARYQLCHRWLAGWLQTPSGVWVYYTKES